MKIFSNLYLWTLKWAKHKYASVALAIMSFSESVFFPIPPDVLLAPMVLSKREKAWHFAAITTIASIVGGVVGYSLGYLMFDPWIAPLISEFGYQDKFDHVMQWFEQWGIWVVFLAGFSPIPYKIFTVSAGFLQMAFLPFILASAVSRGARFFLVAGIIKFGGEAMEDKLKQWIDIIGWLVIVLVVIIYLIIK